MKISNQKGASEVLSYILVIFIVIGVVGLIASGVMPAIEKTKSQSKFQEAKMYVSEIEQKINELMQSPNGSVISITLDLDEMALEIDSNLQTIEIVQTINGDYYKEGDLIKEGNIYTFREMQKLIVGLDLTGIEIIDNFYLTNSKTTVYIKKIDRNKVSFLREIDSSDNLPLAEKERPGIDDIANIRYTTYKYLVENNDGEIIDAQKVKNTFSFLSENNLHHNLILSLSTDFGMKKDTENRISELYDISNYSNNAIQEDEELRPIYNQGIEFTSNLSYLNSGNHESLRMTNDFTVSAWIKTNSTSSSNKYFLRRYDSVNNKRVWGFIVRGSQNYVSAIMSSTGINASYSNGNTNVLDNAWHQVIFTHKDGTVKIYVDGLLDVSSSNYETLFDTDTEFHINVDNTNNYIGLLNDIYIFNKALTIEEIGNLYNYTKTKYE